MTGGQVNSCSEGEAVKHMTEGAVKDKLKKISADRDRLAARRQALSDRLAELDRDKGQAYLDGNFAPAQYITEINAELSAIDSAVATLNGQEQGAKREELAEKVRAKRAEAESLKQELADLNRKTELLLQQLSKLELEGGQVYTRSILGSQHTPNTPFSLQPRSKRLLDQIEKTESEATEIERSLRPPADEQRPATRAKDPAQETRDPEARSNKSASPVLTILSFTTRRPVAWRRSERRSLAASHDPC
jgi:hypothetical protein